MAERRQEPERGFAPDELAARTARAQALMAAAGIDILLFTTEPEFRYFSGFLTQFWQSPTRPWFLLVPAAGKPVAVVPSIGAECLARTWLDDVRSWPSPRPEDEGVTLLAEAVRELAGPRARIGVPMGPETHLRMPLADHTRLVAGLEDCAFVDAGAVVRELRMVKSPAEIGKIAHICALVSDVFEALPGFVTTGMSEAEIFRAFRIECLQRGADDVPYLVGGAAPGGVGDIISPPSERRTEPGDVLMLDTGATFDGYYCDFDRNYAFGQADDDARRAYATVRAAVDAGFAAARPGVTCAGLFQAMQAVLERGGALGNDVGRLGHGLGMQLTEWPSHRPGDETVIRPGMVLTLEPGMTFRPGRVMVLEENIVIGENGPAWLTRPAPAELPVIGEGG
ncbi:MAG: peptidase M24 [Rhizobiales bacterium NRL2]|jgi:Xaa-Pro aminopeptidase|nr:MAG: peptidase M24 [Rhizobiales bacterium NRL2]